MVAELEGPEDRKPQSDDVRSAFALPVGTGATPPAGPHDSSTTSEFAVPEGFSAEAHTEPEGSAFALPQNYHAPNSRPCSLPPMAFRELRLPKEAPWQDRMRTMLRIPLHERPALEAAQRREGESGHSVPRVLDLTLRIGELLLAGGEGAEDVEAAMFGVTQAYGLERCEPTVTFTLLSISHQPSLVDDPVTASRTVRRRGTDYTRLAAVYHLIGDITSEDVEVSLEEAYRSLAGIRRNRHPYPGWVLTCASGLLAGAASVLVGGGALVFAAAMVGAILGDRLAWLLAGRGLPEFYQFAVAAMPPVAVGVALTLADVPDLRASAVITGGLFALLPGRALVAGVQDGLTGYYITASARLLEVVYFFIAIVTGVLVMLYLGLQLHASLDAEAAVPVIDRPVVQIIASMGLTFTFADPAPAGPLDGADGDPERRCGLGDLRSAALRREILTGTVHGHRRRPGRTVRAVVLALPVCVGAALRYRGDRATHAGFRNVLRDAVHRAQRPGQGLRLADPGGGAGARARGGGESRR